MTAVLPDQPADVLLILEARDAALTGRARRLREAAGLAQTEVARHIGVTPSCVSRWEAGQRRPAGDSAVRWTRLLHDLADYLAKPSALNESSPAAEPGSTERPMQAAGHGTG